MHADPTLVRTEVAEVLVKNYTVMQVQQHLRNRGIILPLSTVKRYVAEARGIMRERRKMALEERVDHELNVVEHIRNLALNAYAASSRGTTVIDRSEEFPIGSRPVDEEEALVPAPFAGNNLTSKVTIKTKTTVAEAGDPRFLDVALKASGDIRNMLMIEPTEVKRLEVTVQGGYSEDELNDMDPTQLAALINEQIKITNGS